MKVEIKAEKKKENRRDPSKVYESKFAFLYPIIIAVIALSLLYPLLKGIIEYINGLQIVYYVVQ